MCFSSVATLHQRVFEPASRCEAKGLTTMSLNPPLWSLSDPVPLEMQLLQIWALHLCVYGAAVHANTHKTHILQYPVLAVGSSFDLHLWHKLQNRCCYASMEAFPTSSLLFFMTDEIQRKSGAHSSTDSNTLQLWCCIQTSKAGVYLLLGHSTFVWWSISPLIWLASPTPFCIIKVKKISGTKTVNT